MKLKLFTALIVIYSLVLLTACPQQATLEKAQRESGRIAGYANATIDVVRELYQQKIISIEQKDQIADKLILLARGGKAFDAAVAQLRASYGGTDYVPKFEWQKLLASFDADVVNNFLDVLAALKVIKASEQLKNAINLLITAIKVIARAFSVEQSVGAKINALAPEGI